MGKAAGELILSREPHLKSLLERLKEPRARRVIEPVILGSPGFPGNITDGIRYAVDLGIATLENNGYKPSNPIYREVIIRYLTDCFQFPSSPNDTGNLWMDGKI
jgi:hypothetical protein